MSRQCFVVDCVDCSNSDYRWKGGTATQFPSRRGSIFDDVCV